MKLSFKKDMLTSNEIGQYIKSHGGIKGARKPYVCIPILKNNNFHYFEKKSNNKHSIEAPLACGVNKNNRRYLPNSIFVFINDDSTNAIAAKINQTPIIGIYTGSIADIEYNANLMVGTIFEQENFPSSLLKRKNIYINNDETLIATSEESLLGYKDERILSYMVSEAALRFLVLHEIGHHIVGHISELEKTNNFVLLKATDKMNSTFELQADSYAASKLAEEYGLVLSGLRKHKKDLDINSIELDVLALSTIVFAMTLPFSILYQPDSSELIERDIESTIAYREISAVLILIAGLYNIKKCRDAAVWDICHQDISELQKVSDLIDVQRIKSEKNIELIEFTVYIREVFINCKRLYFKVNNISDIDFYLENYIKVISYLKSE